MAEKIIKVDIISGFLGAGKTTLIRKLLEEALKGEKCVLIENEFGEIGVDNGFLKDAGIDIKEMNSGCICCSLVGDFGTALKEVIDTYAPDRIIIEPSGVGKLSDVIKAVMDLGLENVVVNSASTVVDADKAKLYNKNFGEFFDNQIKSAGTIILSRTQLIDDGKVMDAAQIIQGLNEHARIVTTDWEKLDAKKILSEMEGHSDLVNVLMDELEHPDRHYHDHGDGHFHYHDDEGHEHEAGAHDHDHDHDHDHEHDHEHDHDHDHEHSHEHTHEHGHSHTHGDGEEHEHTHHHHHDHDHSHEEGHEEEHTHDHSEGEIGNDHDHHADHHDHSHDLEHHDHDHHHHEHHDEEHTHSHHDHDGEHGHHHHGEEEHHHHDHDHGHHHDHDHDHGHHHDHGHDHGHHHDHDHDHGDSCSCGCGHDHDHGHHDHAADEVFESWAVETPAVIEKEALDAALEKLADGNGYGTILRAKGMISDSAGSWMFFDMVPGEYEIREGTPETTGKIVVIGTDLEKEKIKELFGV